MSKTERDTIRQVLEGVLERLRDETTNGQVGSESIVLPSDGPLSSTAHASDSPLILVVAGDLRARLQNSSPTQHACLGDARNQGAVNSSATEHPGRKVSHPGLERFNIGEGAEPGPVPKACFMEPSRVCVNSGACEMRGF
jgi:hypothetical protein